MLFIIPIFIVIIYLNSLLSEYKLIKIGSLLFGIGLFYLFFFNVTYNNDWEGYENMFHGNVDSRDFLFGFLSNVFQKYGFEYLELYQFHIILILLFFIYFISRFSYSYIFTVISIYTLIQFLPVTNQIRYYLAFSVFLVSLYTYIFLNKKGRFLFLFLFSFLAHKAVLFLFLFLFFYYRVKDKRYEKTILFLSFIVFFIPFILNIIIGYFSDFESYLEADYTSSFIGGLFSNFIWLIWFLYIYFQNLKLKEIEVDEKYKFLYKLSIFPFLFFPLSFSYQILTHRFVIAMLFVWIIYFLYSLNYIDLVMKKIVSITSFLLLVTFTFFYVFVLPKYLIGSSPIDDVLLVFFSNKSLYFLLP